MVKYKIILILLTISLISSIILSLDQNSSFCNIGGGCDIVKNSTYASTFGIKNYYYGIVVFTFLIIITLMHIHKKSDNKYRILALGLLTSSAIAIYFIFLQIFILKAFCSFCMVVDISILIATAVFMSNKLK